MKRGEFSISSIVGMIIVAIVLIAVAVPISIQTINGVTNPTYFNQTLSVQNNTYSTLTNYPIDIQNGEANNPVNITNGTGYPLTFNVNYTLLGAVSGVSYNGTIYFNQINKAWNTTVVYNANANYNYQQSGYDTSLTDHTVLQIVPLALAVMLLVVIFTTISSGGDIG